ncbi:MAG: hypothetical protein WBD55_07270 [Dehalococcoidia bacterium]
MFSGALAGLLKVVAVGLTAAGLSAGVYFLAQAGEDASQRAQSRVTPAMSPEPLSPPQDARPTQTPSAPTPTFPPADITPPPDIDTSNWKTYESPLGFTIKYPASWTLRDYETEGLAPGTVKILNKRAQEVGAPADEPTEVWDSGQSWVEINPDPIPRFDITALRSLCGANEPAEPGRSISVREATFSGRPALHCRGDHPTPAGGRIVGETYNVKLPGDRVIAITAYAIDGDDSTLGMLQTILSTVSFEAER